MTQMTLDKVNNKHAYSTPALTHKSSQERHYRKNAKRRGRTLAIITNILFALFIIANVFTMIFITYSGSASKSVFGYSFFTVMTPSMRSEIPQGSLIIVKHLSPWELKRGDNITFTDNQGTIVTHKIIDIYDNYDNSGVRGFETQGINNLNSDDSIVLETDVIGKVVTILPYMGAVLSHFNESYSPIIIALYLCILLPVFIYRSQCNRKKT